MVTQQIKWEPESDKQSEIICIASLSLNMVYLFFVNYFLFEYTNAMLITRAY